MCLCPGASHDVAGGGPRTCVCAPPGPRVSWPSLAAPCVGIQVRTRSRSARALADAVQRFLDAPKVMTNTSESLPRVDEEVQRGMGALTRHQTLLEDAALASDEYLTARAHVDPGPFDHVPICALAHLGPGPFGTRPI